MALQTSAASAAQGSVPSALKSPLLKRLGGIAALIVLGLIGYKLWEGMRDEKDARGWTELVSAENPLAPKEEIPIDGAIRGTSAEPWALLASAKSALAKESLEDAKRYLDQFHAAAGAAHPAIASGLYAKLNDHVVAELAWRADHKAPTANPEPPADRAATLKTAGGEFAIGLYLDEAKDLTKDFLSLLHDPSLEAKVSGGQEGAQVVISIRPKEGTALTDAQKALFERLAKTPPASQRNSLSHFKGAVSFQRIAAPDAAKPELRAAVVLRDMFYYDESQVVFGKVLTGLDVLESALKGEKNADKPDELKEPIAVTEVIDGAGLAAIK